MPKKLSLTEVKYKIKKEHGCRYDYPYIDTEYHNSLSNITVRCSKHGDFRQNVRMHYNGQGCIQCYNDRRIGEVKTPYPKTVDKLLKRFGDSIEIITKENEYKGVHHKFIIRCKKHDKLTSGVISNLLQQHPCSICGKEHVKNSLLINKNFDFSKYVYLENYDFNNLLLKDKIKVKCKKHNSDFETTVDLHLKSKGGGCQICRYDELTKTVNVKNLKKLQKLYKNTDYTFSNSYKDRITVHCKKHGEIRRTVSLIVLQKLTPCSKCNIENNKVRRQCSFEDFVKRSKALKKERYCEYKKINNEWEGLSSIINIKCDNHGWFEQRAVDHLHNDADCPKCSSGNHQSSQELQVFDFLKSLNVKIEQHNRSLLDGKEIDIFLPEFNIGIEINGLYYHSDKILLDNKYHFNKNLLAIQKGIRLIFFWEDQIVNDFEVVKKYLLNVLHKIENKIYARQCVVDGVDKEKAISFLNTVHLQGGVSSSKYLGLFHNRILVAVLSYTEYSNAIVITRYASNNVVGGFAKLFKKVPKNKKIVTYCDKSLFTGKLYEVNGFKKDKELKADYQYVKGMNRYHKFNFRKNKIKNKFPDIYAPTKTEKQMMKEAGYNRIYDCGKIRYVFKV